MLISHLNHAPSMTLLPAYHHPALTLTLHTHLLLPAKFAPCLFPFDRQVTSGTIALTPLAPHRLLLQATLLPHVALTGKLIH
jgi:hypothetical protein